MQNQSNFLNSNRVKQRFEYFERAFLNLQKICGISEFNELEKEGVIQRFEILFELSWKIMKDFLSQEGFEIKSPKEAIRQAFGYGLIDDGDGWIRALNRRNITSHTYTDTELDENVKFVIDDFYVLVKNLYENLKDKV